MDLAGVDERVEASLELVDELNPDELVWTVERAADEIDGLRRLERREQRTVQAGFVALQPSFDGSVRRVRRTGPDRRSHLSQRLGCRQWPP
ncbi:MAG: hypothetical protein M3N32_07350 [Actinomycetota bacterium]|nr:hypothetical protein [Actinomycetota bacterium]